jgi:hypothetical protein
MADERIRVEFERTGGFGGVVVRRTVDTATLAPEDADELRMLLDRADLDGVRPVPRTSPVPDAQHYQLFVVRGDRQWTVALSDPEVPATLRPLLRYLAAAGQAEGRGPRGADTRP